MNMLFKLKRQLNDLSQKQRKIITGALTALLILAIFLVVETPAAMSAANTRQLPIYSVERDQKMVSLSFDAAWGDA